MQRTAKRFFGFVPSLFSVLMGVCLIIILALLVVGQPALSQYYKPLSQLSNAALYPAALIVIVLLFFAASKADRPFQNHRLLSVLLQLAVLGVQFLIARSCWYKMGWDVATVYTTAEELALGLPPTQLEYFQGCPNNAPLTFLHFIPLWFAGKLGLAVPFVVLPYVDALLLNLTAFTTVRCVEKLTQSRVAVCFANVLAIGWIALSPYILYPYTDTFGVLFPVLALYCFLSIKTPWLKWLLISCLCFFGMTLKPMALIVLIALVMLGVCRFIVQGDFGKSAWKQAVILVLAVIVGMIPGKVFQDQTTIWLTGTTTPQQQLSETHYLMLGMNGETFSGHSPADVEYSRSFETLSERRAANLSRAWERLTSRSFSENAHFFAVKAYKAYGDGSFASHSSFLELETPKRTDSLSLFLRSLYHKRGALMPYCQTLIQGVWLAVLTLCAYACFRLRKHAGVPLLALTLVGLTAYVLLLEVWPRYLFLYAPFFVVLASMAFEKPLSFKR